LSGLALVSDDYSKYASTAAFLANVSSNIGGTGNYLTSLYNDGVSANLAQIDPSVQYNGHATLKYNQPGGSAASPSFEVYFPNGKTLTKMWLRAKIRFSPGFTTTGTLSNSANAYKALGWGWNTYDGSGRLEITNTNQYDFYWTPIYNGSSIGGGTHTSAGTVGTQWTDGAWYDYIIECDFSNGITGVSRVWISKDGQTPVLRATSSGALTGGRALPGLDYVALGLNFNQVRAANQTQALWYGQWEVVDGVAHPDPFGLGVQ
jgi:hypothetical protein